MKFFTRDLYRRCRSQDENVLNAASEDWERANEEYERHLSSLDSTFPPNVREFVALLLHDAKVQSIARNGNQLILVLHKDIPPRNLVILRYELVGEPIVEAFVDSPADWNRPTTFQFDEMDIERVGIDVIYCQEIVFDSGWSLRLRFRDVQVSVARTMYPTSVAGLATGLFQPQAL